MKDTEQKPEIIKMVDRALQGFRYTKIRKRGFRRQRYS